MTDFNCDMDQYPDERYEINLEELENLVLKSNELIKALMNTIFHRKELFDAWYAYKIDNIPINAIAAVQKISKFKAQKRIDTAQEIIMQLRKSLHKIDDFK
jgi:hypothetical protein